VKDVKIFLKSGQIVEFTANSIEKRHDAFGGTNGLIWGNIPGRTQLFDIDIDQIAAITVSERQEVTTDDRQT
jgi:hypothetical protein